MCRCAKFVLLPFFELLIDYYVIDYRPLRMAGAFLFGCGPDCPCTCQAGGMMVADQWGRQDRLLASANGEVSLFEYVPDCPRLGL